MAFFFVTALALVPGYGFVAPTSRWDDPALLVVLGALAVIAHRSVVRLPSGVGFDALFALMLIAVALAGPLPALEVIVLPWVDTNLVRRRPPAGVPAILTAPGYLTGYGWSAIAAALLLQAAGVHDPASLMALGWMIGAGAVLDLVGWALGPAIYIPLWHGHPFKAAVQALRDMLPAAAAMIALAAATVALTSAIGLMALAVFAFIAVLPQSFLTYAGRARPVARLDRDTATRRYAHALAVQLGLSRAERRHLARVLAAARRDRPDGAPITYIRATLNDPSGAASDAQLTTEWWNGAGTPLGLRAEEIPLATRVLAVAYTWSALTARGTPQLSHRDALNHLRAVAGDRLDAAVVQAAHAVVGQELVSDAVTAPEPRLHHFRIPAPLRRALAAR